ncbi:MAG: hypothetical protein Rubg2KO_16310 [Rubricoccaceae bacterium]
MSTPAKDDRDGLILSVSLHVLLLLIAALSIGVDQDPTPEPPVKLVELDLLELAPTIPVQMGPPQRAEAGAPATPRQSLEPPRPAPPAATPVQPPPRTRQTPPRPNPLPRPANDPNASPARPNPPSNTRQPEPDPTPRQQVEPTQGNGATQGDSPTSGTNDGPASGSGGDAPAEVGFQFGNRSFTCPSPAFPGVEGTITFSVTFAPNGRYVTSRPRSRNATFTSAVQRVISGCRAQPLPPNATQTNQSTVATFNFRASN